jgi:hypothetical protein
MNSTNYFIVRFLVLAGSSIVDVFVSHLVTSPRVRQNRVLGDFWTKLLDKLQILVTWLARSYAKEAYRRDVDLTLSRCPFLQSPRSADGVCFDQCG